MTTGSYSPTGLGKFTLAWDQSVIVSSKGFSGQAVWTFPLARLNQRPSALTRNTVVHPVVFALIAFAPWAFLPVCLEIRL